MTSLPTTNISLSAVASLFAPGKAGPHRYSEFYKGGAYVGASDVNPFGIPSAGAIGIGNFRGAAKYVAPVAKSVSFVTSFTAPADLQNTRITSIVLVARPNRVGIDSDPNNSLTAPNTITFRCNETQFTSSVTYNASESMASASMRTWNFTGMKLAVVPGKTYTFSVASTTYPAENGIVINEWGTGTLAYEYLAYAAPSPYTLLGFNVSIWIGGNTWGTKDGVSINDTWRMDSLAATAPVYSGRTQAVSKLYEIDTPSSNFAQKFVGAFVPKSTGTHTFTIAGNDYAMMWLGAAAATPGTTNTNSNYLVRNGFGMNDGTHVAGISLTAGVAYPILVYHGETNNYGEVGLSFVPPEGGSAIADFLSYVFH